MNTTDLLVLLIVGFFGIVTALALTTVALNWRYWLRQRRTHDRLNRNNLREKR